MALARSPRERELIENYASTLDELERPILIEGRPEKLDRAAVEQSAGFSEFDLVLGRDLLKGSSEPEGLLARLASQFPGARFASMESLAREGGRLSALPLTPGLDEGLASRFVSFEEDFYGEGGPAELGLCAEDRSSNAGNQEAAARRHGASRRAKPRPDRRPAPAGMKAPASASLRSCAPQICPRPLWPFSKDAACHDEGQGF